MTTFNVYRRKVGDTNPPVAIATGLTSKEYSDVTAEAGKSYLYSVGVVKNGIEKISDEISIYAGGDEFFNNVDLLIFADSTAFTDYSSKLRTISKQGNISLIQSSFPVTPLFDNGLIYLKGGYLSSRITNVANNKFTTELFF